jgi:hypothetical protein
MYQPTSFPQPPPSSYPAPGAYPPNPSGPQQHPPQSNYPNLGEPNVCSLDPLHGVLGCCVIRLVPRPIAAVSASGNPNRMSTSTNHHNPRLSKGGMIIPRIPTMLTHLVIPSLVCIVVLLFAQAARQASNSTHHLPRGSPPTASPLLPRGPLTQELPHLRVTLLTLPLATRPVFHPDTQAMPLSLLLATLAPLVVVLEVHPLLLATQAQ